MNITFGYKNAQGELKAQQFDNVLDFAEFVLLNRIDDNDVDMVDFDGVTLMGPDGIRTYLLGIVANIRANEEDDEYDAVENIRANEEDDECDEESDLECDGDCENCPNFEIKEDDVVTRCILVHSKPNTDAAIGIQGLCEKYDVVAVDRTKESPLDHCVEITGDKHDVESFIRNWYAED